MGMQGWTEQSQSGAESWMTVIGNIMFVVVPIIILAGFGCIVFTIIKRGKAVKTAPLLCVPARVVTKRTDVWGDRAYTNYYVTFEFESGDRTELSLTGEQFGMLAEGDIGRLTFKGPQFLSFER